MAKATAKRSVRSARHPAGDDALRRFVDGPVRSTRPTQRNVQTETVDIDSRTLTAIVATGTSRILEVYDDDLRSWIEVEEVIDIAGVDLSRVESGMQFLDNHNSWSLDDVLGVVTEARQEELDGVGPAIIADIKMSSRTELDSLVQDLADGIVGCISCQYRPVETTLELRDGDRPLLTVVKSELLEVSLVSVPADPNAMVRSETSLKGQSMAGKPTQGARGAAKRALAARTAKRADDAATGANETLDDAAIAEIVDAVIEEIVPAVIEEVTAAVGDDEGTGEPEARADDDAGKTADEDEEGKTGGAATDVRSMIRNRVRSALGMPAPGKAKADVELTQIRSMADKYGVRSQLNDMEAMKVPVAELRSFVVNATAARSGTGPTHDGRNNNPQRGNDQLIGWGDTARGKRSAERATRR